jgi:hypothetical protein
MNSSTFSSDDESAAGYRRWLVRFCCVFLFGLLLSYVGVVLCDPFSTGRMSAISGLDIAISNRALSNAARARDPRFDSAIIGNSHGIALDPARLSALTILNFVQLGVLSVGPEEELAIAEAFTRIRIPAALVWVVDDGWCSQGKELFHPYDRFPFWLYGTNTLDYLRHIFSIDAIQASIHRVAIHFGDAPQAGRIDGRPTSPSAADDIEFDAARAQLAIEHASVSEETTGATPDHGTSIGAFPFIDRAEKLIQQLGEHTGVLFIFMPYQASALPPAGSRTERVLASCKTRFYHLAQSRPMTTVIDRLRDDDVARNANNFNDATHVSPSFARTIEMDLARIIRRQQSESGTTGTVKHHGKHTALAPTQPQQPLRRTVPQ